MSHPSSPRMPSLRDRYCARWPMPRIRGGARERQAEEARHYAITEFARELLPVADNLQRTITTAEGRRRARRPVTRRCSKGSEPPSACSAAAFERFGVRRIAAEGAAFDPTLHEAVMEVDDPRRRRPARSSQVLEDGYTIHDRLLRPARVVVAKRRRATATAGSAVRTRSSVDGKTETLERRSVSRFWASTRMPPRRTSRRPIGGWPRSCTLTSIPATSRPRSSSRRFRRPTICWATRRSARASTAARSMLLAPSGRASASIATMPAAPEITTRATPALPTSLAADDIFAELFGRGGRANIRMRGQDAHYRLELDFLDAINGGKRQVTLPDGSVLDVSIPAGTRDGQILRLRGKGMAGPRRRAARRRAGRDRGPPASHLHAQGRRHPRRAADLAARSRARRQGQRADADGRRDHDHTEMVQHRHACCG